MVVVAWGRMMVGCVVMMYSKNSVKAVVGSIATASSPPVARCSSASLSKWATTAKPCFMPDSCSSPPRLFHSCCRLKKTSRLFLISLRIASKPPPASTTTTEGNFTGWAVSGWAQTPQLNSQVLKNNNSRWIFALLHNMPVTFKNKI